jgi:hypothetical protein
LSGLTQVLILSIKLLSLRAIFQKTDMNIRQSWELLLSDRKKIYLLGLLVITGVFCTYSFSCFMVWNESRPGIQLHDPVLAHIPPHNFSLITSILTNLPIYIGLLWTMRRPQGVFYVFAAAIAICFLRMFTLFAVPLDPPAGIIPLRDIVIESLFYQGNVIQKDLFFSGHTANLLLVALLVDTKWMKKILVVCAVAVGSLLMIQHVHYTIDVLAAPFFAYLAYKVSVYIVNRYLLMHTGLELRSGRVLEEFGLRRTKEMTREYTG